MTPGQWENISDDNMTRAEQEKASSASLRVLVDSLLEQASTDLQKQLQATAASFQLKVKEIKSAKSRLEHQLAEVEAGRERVDRCCCNSCLLRLCFS